MLEVGKRYELELIDRNGTREIIQGKVIGRDGALVQIQTDRGERLLNILPSAFVSAHLIEMHEPDGGPTG